MNEELLDVLDENGIKTGKILPRKEIHKRGLWHRAILVAILNEKNEILIQQRSADKDKNANMWDISVAGHISAGQDSLSAAAREINEEVSVNLGFNVDIKEFRFMFSFRYEHEFTENFTERLFYDFFILRQNNLNIDDIKFQTSEVQAVKFVSISELSEMNKQGLMVDRDEYFEALIEYLFRI